MKPLINKGFYFNNIFAKLEGLKKVIYIAAVTLISFAIISCKKKKDPEVIDLGEAYYPGTIGSFIVYDVDSIVFAEIGFDSTHYKYQIKEKIEQEYTDAQNRPALKLVRYIKKFNAAVSYTAMPWTLKDVWQVNKSKGNVEVVEENIRFVKLIFPVKEKSKWNGNSTNTLGQWDYEYTYTDKTETVNSINFGKVALVTQKSFPTLISREYYAEKYAKDIGLVHREITNITFKDTVVPLSYDLFKVKSKYGVVYTSKVISYGNE